MKVLNRDHIKVQDGNYRVHLDNGLGLPLCDRVGQVVIVDNKLDLSCLKCLDRFHK